MTTTTAVQPLEAIVVDDNVPPALSMGNGPEAERLMTNKDLIEAHGADTLIECQSCYRTFHTQAQCMYRHSRLPQTATPILVHVSTIHIAINITNTTIQPIPQYSQYQYVPPPLTDTNVQSVSTLGSAEAVRGLRGVSSTANRSHSNTAFSNGKVRTNWRSRAVSRCSCSRPPWSGKTW